MISLSSGSKIYLDGGITQERGFEVRGREERRMDRLLGFSPVDFFYFFSYLPVGWFCFFAFVSELFVSLFSQTIWHVYCTCRAVCGVGGGNGGGDFFGGGLVDGSSGDPFSPEIVRCVVCCVFRELVICFFFGRI